MLFTFAKNPPSKLSSHIRQCKHKATLFHVQLSLFATEREAILSSFAHFIRTSVCLDSHYLPILLLLTTLLKLSAGLRSVLFVTGLRFAAISVLCRKSLMRWFFDGRYRSLSLGGSGVRPKEYFVPVIRQIRHWG